MRLGRYPQPFSTPQSLNPFAIYLPALLIKFRSDPPVAVAGMLLSQLVKALDQTLVLIYPSRSVLLRAPGLTKHPADPPFAHAQFAPDMSYSVTARSGR